jgi:hypothetical protein
LSFKLTHGQGWKWQFTKAIDETLIGRKSAIGFVAAARRCRFTISCVPIAVVTGFVKARKSGALVTAIFFILLQRDNNAMHNDYVTNHIVFE